MAICIKQKINKMGSEKKKKGKNEIEQRKKT
jgi:hypothetical protein